MLFSMTRWSQMKKLSTTKFHNFSRSTTFILIVYSNEVIWKAQKIQFQINFTGGFLKQPPVEIWFLVVVPLNNRL